MSNIITLKDLNCEEVTIYNSLNEWQMVPQHYYKEEMIMGIALALFIGIVCFVGGYRLLRVGLGLIIGGIAALMKH